MEYLYDHPGLTAAEMAECIRVDKETLTKVIKKLSENGFVEIIPGKDDKRKKHLYLTNKALPASKRIKEIHGSFFDVPGSGISAEDMESTGRVLEMMAENIHRALRKNLEV